LLCGSSIHTAHMTQTDWYDESSFDTCWMTLTSVDSDEM
jgi:hypothetical protein